MNENDNFKYSDAIDYKKKAIKEGQKNLMVILKNGHLKKMMAKLVLQYRFEKR